MKIPETAKTFEELFLALPAERIPEAIGKMDLLPNDDRYLHWDEIRRRPPPQGLTLDEWWLGLKIQRAAGKKVPLEDKKGRIFSYRLPDSVMASLHEIDLGLGSSRSLPGAVTNPASRNEYVISSLIQEAITSSQLEGAATTREVAKEMLRTGRKPRDVSEKMILNNFHTMQRIMEVRASKLTPELVLELQRLVTDGTLEKPDGGGRFRRADENIRVIDEENVVYHDPPPAAGLPERIQKMCAFANGETPDFFVHPVIRAILLHFWLAYDHPFVDGNGRTARALFYWSMLHQGFQLFEFISISQVILKAPVQYSMAFLYVETDENDLTYFILHQAGVIRGAIKALYDYVEHRKSMLAAAERRLRGIEGLNHRQQGLIADALRNAGARYTIEGHKRTHGVVYQTARSDLLVLEGRGFLKAEKTGRFMVFRPSEDLAKRLDESGRQRIRRHAGPSVASVGSKFEAPESAASDSPQS
jgi:Fic family protein